MVRTRILLVILLASIATTGVAKVLFGPITFSPAAPTAVDPIQVTFMTIGACAFDYSTVVTGNVVRTTVSVTSCVLGPPSPVIPRSTVIGPLAPNTYTYELYLSYEGSTPVFQAETQLVVTAPPPAIPTLSPAILTMLAASLMLTAALILRRAS